MPECEGMSLELVATQRRREAAVLQVRSRTTTIWVPPSRAPGSRHAWISISRKRSSHASLRAERKFAADAMMTRQECRPSNCSRLLQRYMRRTWPLFSSPSRSPVSKTSTTARCHPNSDSGELFQEGACRAEQRHYAEQDTPTSLRHAQELGESAISVAEDVAQRAAKADHRVERTVWKPAEVGDVQELARLNRAVYAGGLLGIQLKLSRRDITNHHSRSEGSKLQREAARAGSRIQHTVAPANVLTEKPQMHLKSHTVHCAEIEALPLARAVLVVETCDVLRVVLSA